MLFKPFFFGLDALERKKFAFNVGTTVKHLTNFSYGYTVLNPAVCVAVERESGCAVTRQDLRSDWRDIWPELIGVQIDAQIAVHKPTHLEIHQKLAEGLGLVERRVLRLPFKALDRRIATPCFTDIDSLGQTL